MGAIKAKMAEWAGDKALVKLFAGIMGLVLVLMICLCISNCMRSNIQKKYSLTMDTLQVHAYQNMEEMTQLFAYIDDPNIDVRGKLLPELKSRYNALSAIHAAMTANSKKAALLSDEEFAAFDAAFEQYAQAFRSGSATGLAKADLAACMEHVQELVTIYNTPVDDEKDDVLVIDASSGKAVTD